MALALKIQDLKKSFRLGFIPKYKQILKGISLSVEEGEIFGYLGPNGAGKTTTIKTILGLIFPDSGSVEIFGQPHLSYRARTFLGFLPENPYFYDYLNASEFLSFYADLFGMNRQEKEKRIDFLLKLVGLERAGSLQLRKFSRGMLQRIGLAQALINDPKLVVLDEPLGGMDPIGRKELRDIIVRFKEEGKTVFFTSHILQDIEMICDHVAIIVGGHIVKQGALEDLVSEKIIYTEISLSGISPDSLRSLGEEITVKGNRVFLKIYNEKKVDAVLELVASARGTIHYLSPKTETLEDIFVDTVSNR